MRISLFVLLIIALTGSRSFGQTEFSIAEIQGAGLFTPLLNDQVTVNNVVVTAINQDLLYVQSINTDNNPSSSEGIMVRWSDAEDFSTNDLVQIVGTVREFDNNTAIQAQSITLTGKNQNSISPIVIDDAFPGAALQAINPLEFVEGQLVSYTDMRITGPSEGGNLAYISGATDRPLREPGAESPGIDGLPVWDGNPEVFFFKPRELGLASNEFLHTNMKISGTGIIVQERFNYSIHPITYTISQESTPPVTVRPTKNEFNIACLNTLFLEQEDASYDLRLQKIANYIQNVLGTPDVIALQEVGGTQEFEDLAALLSSLTLLDYKAYSINATSNINNGYLVQSTFIVENVTALGTGLTFEGNRLHDRPPLLLEGSISTAMGPKPLSILNLHQRSLNGITGNNSGFVRRKRNAQAISVGQFVKNIQTEGKQIMVVGDFNAYQFSDGYVDVVNQISGATSLGAEFPIQGLGIQTLSNISATFPPIEERYSFVFRGNAQMLDHCLVSDFTDFEVSHFQYGRGNSDYPDSMLEQDVPFRATDHDGFSVFLDMQNEVVLGNTMVLNGNDFLLPNPFNSDSQISFSLSEKQIITIELFNTSGQLMRQVSLDSIKDDKLHLPFLGDLRSGIYFLKVSGRSIDRTEKLIILK